MQHYQFEVDEASSKKRLDIFLSENLPEISRSRLKKLIDEKRVTVNERCRPASYKVQVKEKIEFHIPPLKELDTVSENIPLDMKFLSRIDYKIHLQKFLSIKTSLLFLKQGPHKEIVAGIEGNYISTSFMDINRSFWVGIFYRNKDALFISAGVIHDQWKVGLSYDINLSKLIPASRNRGGFEFGLIYFIKRKLNLENPLLICPDYL